MLLLGFWSGWNSRGSWGLQNELSVHISDSQVGSRIYRALFNEELKHKEKWENIKDEDITDCGNVSIGDLLHSPEEPD